MLISNHPHDERLSALASGDPDAVADASLSEHVASCHRCTETVAELGALRASLAELPDVAPHRPLQLLPPVTDADPSPVDRVGGWARQLFAPLLTAGAALALVGLVGTTGVPILGGASSGAAPMEFEDSGDVNTNLPAAGGAAASEEPSTLGGAGEAAASAEPDHARASGDSAESEGGTAAEPFATERQVIGTPDSANSDSERLSFNEERSIWPMLLFAGVALMIAAALLRWILAPRAG